MVNRGSRDNNELIENVSRLPVTSRKAEANISSYTGSYSQILTVRFTIQDPKQRSASPILHVLHILSLLRIMRYSWEIYNRGIDTVPIPLVIYRRSSSVVHIPSAIPWPVTSPQLLIESLSVRRIRQADRVIPRYLKDLQLLSSDFPELEFGLRGPRRADEKPP